LTQAVIFAQVEKTNTKLLPKLMKKEKIFDSILKNPGVYDVQIIYTRIDRKKDGITFVNHHYNVSKNKYFYPANAVFLPVAALTLEKISALAKEYDVDKDRFVKIDNALTQEIILYQDTSSANHYATFADFIKQMFVAGDKNACNYCYDFLNQRYLNERMHGMGYGDSWFLHKLDSNPPETSRRSNVVTFFRTNVMSYYIDIIYLKRHPTTIPFYSIYVKKGEYNPDDYYTDRPKISLGRGFVENGAVVDSAVDFTVRNKFTIEDMHGFLKALMFPETYGNKLKLSDDDYAFLYRQMADNNGFNYILNNRLDDPSIKIFNNSGKDMGFMIDNAYVVDTKNGVDFLLTAVIKCNKTDIFGEEYYEYERTGLPFMKNLSNMILEYEIRTKQKNQNFENLPNKITDKK
jgi:hypothetical protein